MFALCEMSHFLQRQLFSGASLFSKKGKNLIPSKKRNLVSPYRTVYSFYQQPEGVWVSELRIAGCNLRYISGFTVGSVFVYPDGKYWKSQDSTGTDAIMCHLFFFLCFKMKLKVYIIIYIIQPWQANFLLNELVISDLCYKKWSSDATQGCICGKRESY